MVTQNFWRIRNERPKRNAYPQNNRKVKTMKKIITDVYKNTAIETATELVDLMAQNNDYKFRQVKIDIISNRLEQAFADGNINASNLMMEANHELGYPTRR